VVLDLKKSPIHLLFLGGSFAAGRDFFFGKIYSIASGLSFVGSSVNVLFLSTC
jgi:hypothetical protein